MSFLSLSCSSLATNSIEFYIFSACVADRAFWQQFERVTGARRKSEYPQAVDSTQLLSRCSRQETFGSCLCRSIIESYHAEAGRVADRTGCKRSSADIEAEGSVRLSRSSCGGIVATATTSLILTGAF
eukprot:3755814-Pleurochrysis_carterae.AAC.1